MIEHFDKLLDRLEELGYEVDSESLELLEMYNGYGYLHFIASESIGFSLPFDDYALDLNRDRHSIKFFRNMRVLNLPTSYSLKIEGLEDSPRIDLEIKSLPSKLEEALKTGVDILKAIKVVQTKARCDQLVASFFI